MNEEKFSGKADSYDKYRPSYPKSLIDWLYEKTEAKAVADIGAGTGKFTVLLSEKNWKITAVEPNSDMLNKLKINAPFAEIIQASAERTKLPDNSVNLITVAQAFHWFDENAFRKECRRILTPNGRLAVIFNIRVHNGFEEEYNNIYKDCKGFRSYAGIWCAEYGEKFLTNRYFKDVDIFKVENDMKSDRENFMGKEISCSYAPKNTDECYETVIGQLSSLFDRHNINGIITEKYQTVCYLGHF